MFITTVLATICAALIVLVIYLNSKVPEPNKLNYVLPFGLIIAMGVTLLALIFGSVGLAKVMESSLSPEDRGQATSQMSQQHKLEHIRNTMVAQDLIGEDVTVSAGQNENELIISLADGPASSDEQTVETIEEMVSRGKQLDLQIQTVHLYQNQQQRTLTCTEICSIS